MLYGGSLSLEFITLIVLRIREPHLKREFKVPGGLAGAATLGIFPLALLALAMVESEHESILGMNGLLFGVIIIATGILGYAATKKFRHPRTSRPSPQPQPNNPPPATNPQLRRFFLALVGAGLAPAGPPRLAKNLPGSAGVPPAFLTSDDSPDPTEQVQLKSAKLRVIECPRRNPRPFS